MGRGAGGGRRVSRLRDWKGGEGQPKVRPRFARTTHAVPLGVVLQAVRGHGLAAQQDVQRVGEEVAIQVGAPAEMGRAHAAEGSFPVN